MTRIRFCYLRSLALVSAVLLSSSVVAAQAQATGQASTQPRMSASSAAMPAGGMMENHDAMPGMAGAAMQDGMKMPVARPSMAKDMPGCCGMKKKKAPMAKSKRSSPHRRHAKPATAKPAPMPAADKPMPMQDDM